MAEVKRRPEQRDPPHDRKLVYGIVLPDSISDLNDFSEADVRAWMTALSESRVDRDDEQSEIRAAEGSEEAFQERLKTDPVFREAWETHEHRADVEEAAFAIFQEKFSSFPN